MPTTITVNDILFRWSDDRRVDALLLIADGLRLAAELEETDMETLRDALNIARAFTEAMAANEKRAQLLEFLSELEADLAKAHG